MAGESMDVRQLLQVEPGTDNAAQILRWYEELQLSVARGDLSIGILGIDEVQLIEPALRHAAQSGDADALFLWGEYLLSPLLGEPNPQAASLALKQAIAAGSARARILLVQIYFYVFEGEARESTQQEAFQLLQAALQENSEDADAHRMLGHLQTAGFGTKKNPSAGYKSQRRAGELGDPDALFELYVHLVTASGVEKDNDAAFGYLQRAAEAGQPRALYNMGAAHAQGIDVEWDMAKAAAYYQEACEAGHGRACATLAGMYATGDGVEQNAQAAAHLFEAAEDEGFDTATIKELVGFEG